MDAPLRVTLVTHYYPEHRGGVEIVAGELARRLTASGAAQITWHAADTDPPPADVRSVPAKSWNVTERHLGFPYPLWSPGALRALQRSIRESDVVHLHDCLYMPNVFAMATARRPVLVTQHIGAIPYRNPGLRLLQRAANRSLGRFVLGRATQTVFVSDAVRRYFQEFVRFRRPPLHIANGVDTSLFKPPPQRTSSDKPFLLFVGRFVEKKGLAQLHRLAAAMPDARWVFAGWGPLDPQAWGLANVTVERTPPRERLVSLYQDADLLVLPSVGEGFPLVVQEAMACGTPALVSDQTALGCPEAGELLPHEPVTDLPRWQGRIRSLVGDQELRTRVAAFARENWSWDRCTQRYAELLRQCAAA